MRMKGPCDITAEGQGPVKGRTKQHVADIILWAYAGHAVWPQCTQSARACRRPLFPVLIQIMSSYGGQQSKGDVNEGVERLIEPSRAAVIITELVLESSLMLELQT